MNELLGILVQVGSLLAGQQLAEAADGSKRFLKIMRSGICELLQILVGLLQGFGLLGKAG